MMDDSPFCGAQSLFPDCFSFYPVIASDRILYFIKRVYHEPSPMDEIVFLYEAEGNASSLREALEIAAGVLPSSPLQPTTSCDSNEDRLYPAWKTVCGVCQREIIYTPSDIERRMSSSFSESCKPQSVNGERAAEGDDGLPSSLSSSFSSSAAPHDPSGGISGIDVSVVPVPPSFSSFPLHSSDTSRSDGDEGNRTLVLHSPITGDTINSANAVVLVVLVMHCGCVVVCTLQCLSTPLEKKKNGEQQMNCRTTACVSPPLSSSFLDSFLSPCSSSAVMGTATFPVVRWFRSALSSSAAIATSSSSFSSRCPPRVIPTHLERDAWEEKVVDSGKTKKTYEKHTSVSGQGFSALPSLTSPSCREDVDTVPLRQDEGEASVENGSSTRKMRENEEKNDGGTKGERGKAEGRTTSKANSVKGKHPYRGAGDECPCCCCVTPIPLTVHYSLQQVKKRSYNDHPKVGFETQTHFFPHDRTAPKSAETPERNLMHGDTDAPQRLFSPIPAPLQHCFLSYTVRIAFTFPPSPLLSIAEEATISYMALHLTWPPLPCAVAPERNTEAKRRGHPMGMDGCPTTSAALSFSASGTPPPISRPIPTSRDTGTAAPLLPVSSRERTKEEWNHVCCTLVAVGVWPLQLSAAGGGSAVGGVGGCSPSTGAISSSSWTRRPPVTTTPEMASARHSPCDGRAHHPAAFSPLTASSPLLCGSRDCTARRVRQLKWLSSTCDYQGVHPLLGILFDSPPYDSPSSLVHFLHSPRGSRAVPHIHDEERMPVPSPCGHEDHERGCPPSSPARPSPIIPTTPCDASDERGKRDGGMWQAIKEEAWNASSPPLSSSSLTHFTLAAVEEVPFKTSSPPSLAGDFSSTTTSARVKRDVERTPRLLDETDWKGGGPTTALPSREAFVHLQGRVVDGPWAVHCLTLSHLSYVLFLDKQKIRQSFLQQWCGASPCEERESGGEVHREANDEACRGGGEGNTTPRRSPPPISDTEVTERDAGPSFPPQVRFRASTPLSAWEREERWYTGEHTVVGFCCRAPSIPYWPKGAIRPRCTTETARLDSTPFALPSSCTEGEARPPPPSSFSVPLSLSPVPHSLFRFSLYDKNGLLAHCPLPSFVESAVTLPMVPEPVRPRHAVVHASDTHSTWKGRRKKPNDGSGLEPSQEVHMLVARVALLVWNSGAVNEAEDADGGRGGGALSPPLSAWTEETTPSTTSTVRCHPREEGKREGSTRTREGDVANDTARLCDGEKAVVILHVLFELTATRENAASPPTPPCSTTHASFSGVQSSLLSAPLGGARQERETEEERVGCSDDRTRSCPAPAKEGHTNTRSAPLPHPHDRGSGGSRNGNAGSSSRRRRRTAALHFPLAEEREESVFTVPIGTEERWQVVPMARVSFTPTWWQRPVRRTVACEGPRIHYTNPRRDDDAEGRCEKTAPKHSGIDVQTKRRVAIPQEGCVQGFWGSSCCFRRLSSPFSSIYWEEEGGRERREGMHPPYVERTIPSAVTCVRQRLGLTPVWWEMTVGMEVVHPSPWQPASGTTVHGKGESESVERQSAPSAMAEKAAAFHWRSGMERGKSRPSRTHCPFCQAAWCFPLLCRSAMFLHLPVFSTTPSFASSCPPPSVFLSFGSPPPSIPPLHASSSCSSDVFDAPSLLPTSFPSFSPLSFSVPEGEFSEEVVLASCTYVHKVRGGTVFPFSMSTMSPSMSSSFVSPPEMGRKKHEGNVKEGSTTLTLCLLRNGWVVASCPSSFSSAPTWHWCCRVQRQEEHDTAMGKANAVGIDRGRTEDGKRKCHGRSPRAAPSSSTSHAVSTAHAKALLELFYGAPGSIQMAVLEVTGSGVVGMDGGEASPNDRQSATAAHTALRPPSLPSPPSRLPAFDGASWRVVFTARHLVVVVRLCTGVVEDVVDVSSVIAHLPGRNVFPTVTATGPKREDCRDDVGEDRPRDGQEENNESIREDKGGVAGVVLHQILPLSTVVPSFASLPGDLLFSGEEKNETGNNPHEREARSTPMGTSFFASPHAEHVFFLLVGKTYEIPHSGWRAPSTDEPFLLSRKKEAQRMRALSAAEGVLKDAFPTAHPAPSSSVRLAFFLLRCTFLSCPCPIPASSDADDDEKWERRTLRDSEEEEGDGGDVPLPFVLLSITDWCDVYPSSFFSSSSSAFPYTTKKEDLIDKPVQPQTPWQQRYAHHLCQSCDTSHHASYSFFFASALRWTPSVKEGEWVHEEKQKQMHTPHSSGGVSCAVCEGEVARPTAKGKRKVCRKEMKEREMGEDATSPFLGRTSPCNPTVATIAATTIKEKGTSVTTYSTDSPSIAEVGVLQMMWEKKKCDYFVSAEGASSDGVGTELDHCLTASLISSDDYWKKVELLFPTMHFTCFTLL